MTKYVCVADREMLYVGQKEDGIMYLLVMLMCVRLYYVDIY